eukprot:6491025-Amphidinium_carterae.2
MFFSELGFYLETKAVAGQPTCNIRERKLAWKQARIIEENKKKDKYRRELLREHAEEEERQKKKREREQGDAASAAASTAVREDLRTPMTFNVKDHEPPRPTREPPKPQLQGQTPATPARQPPVPGLSPRLRLVPENFKNERGRKEDSYYEKKLFDELRQRSYVQEHPTSQHYTSTPEIKRVYDGFKNQDYVEEMKRRRQEIQQRGKEEELEGCANTTTLLQRLLTMSLHYAPDFFKTITTQKRDDLREREWPEEQVRERELDLQGQQLLELYAVLPQKALDMWITCGRIPASYLQDPTDPRHRFYNFHKEVHYAITDYINLYLYNMPTDF